MELFIPDLIKFTQVAKTR